MTPMESRVPGQNPGRNGSRPLPAPTAVELPPALRAALLDPALWRERLEEFAHASNLAIALTDDKGQPLGEYVNSRSLGSRLHDQHPAAITGCPFSWAPLEPHACDADMDDALAWQDEHLLAPPEPCTCVVEALAGRGRVIVRDSTGLVHFAVPLFLGEHPLGALLAMDQGDLRAEQQPVKHLAKQFGLSPDRVWQLSCLEHHVKQTTLHVYATLLMTLGRTILETHYHALRQAEHLAEMTRLSDVAAAEITDRRRIEEGQRLLLEASVAFASRDYTTSLKLLARRAVPFLADFCFLDVVTAEETIHRVGWAHADTALQDRFDQINHFVAPRDWRHDPVSRVLWRDQAEFVPEVTDAWMQSAATSPEHFQLMRDLKLRSLMTVPLIAHERKLGAFTFCYGEVSGRRYTQADLRLAEDLAHRAAIVVENAELNRALRAADRHKDEFLAVVGHELRNPLAAISNAMQLVRLKGLADPELRSATEVIERQAQQMRRLVDDLLDVSLVRQGKIHLSREVVDLRNVVARAVESSRPLIEMKKHELAVSLPERPIEVDGDLTRLTQVVSNLLNNSAKYSEEGGRVELSLEANSDQAILRVSDTGIGIAPATLPTIFDLFTQVQGSEDRSEGGLGIGLNLVRDLIDLHGGCVQATSAGLGHGSEFVVRLPLSRTGHPLPPSAAGVPEETPNGPSQRILIIDDNRDAADTMAMLLRVIGHEAQTAYDGPTALDLAQRQPPDVVLCDVSMPGMGGREVAHRLRHDLELRDALIVAVTGYGQEEDKRRSQQADFNAHLVKPVSLEALQALLGRRATLSRRLP